jgi:hypothetical protein
MLGIKYLTVWQIPFLLNKTLLALNQPDVDNSGAQSNHYPFLHT